MIKIFRYALLMLALGAALPTYAATLSFVAGQGYKVGDTVTATLIVSSSAQAINAVGATVSYPADKLELVSISKAASIINFWAQEPASLGSGTIGLQGVIFDPGWQGQGGRVAQFIFRAKAAGTPALSFSDAQVLANDGKGTNILTGAPSLTIPISAPVQPAPTPAPAAATGGTFITSSTHPDQSRWYNSGQASLDWKNAAGTLAVRIGYDAEPKGTPPVVYGVVAHKDLVLKDGVWYFHVQDKTAAGWGPVSTYKLQIDTTPPLPIPLSFPHGARTTDPRPIALFNTTDALSGIDHYTVKVNGGGLTVVSKNDVSSNPYALPEQDPGQGEVTIIAYDSAGNSTSASGAFEVIGIKPPKLDPVRDITEGDNFQVSGTSYLSSRIDFFLVGPNGTTTQWVRTAGNGAFRVVWQENLRAGAYAVAAQVTDDTGAVSRRTEPMAFNVTVPVLFKLGPISLTERNATILMLILFALSLLGLWWLLERFWHRGYLPVRAGPQGAHTHALVHKQFAALKSAVAHEVRMLEKVKDKRKLTAEEERLINRLGALIEKSEERIEAEVERALED